MHHNVTISPAHIADARQSAAPATRKMIEQWARRLAVEPYLPAYAVTDLIIDATPFTRTHHDLIEQLTGEPAMLLLHHPRGATSTLGGQHWPSAAVGQALLIAARLGVQVPAHELLEPLRRRLAQSRSHPLLTPDELAVLWGAREHRGVHAFRYVGAGAPAPYAVTLTDGRIVLGFANPDGVHVEVIGRRGLYTEAARRGCLLSRLEIRDLIARGTYPEATP